MALISSVRTFETMNDANLKITVSVVIQDLCCFLPFHEYLNSHEVDMILLPVSFY